MPFYIELPADGYGNTALPPAVIEAVPDLNRFQEEELIISAPPELVQWSGFTQAYKFAMVEEGPARLLSREEWRALVIATTGHDFDLAEARAMEQDKRYSL